MSQPQSQQANNVNITTEIPSFLKQLARLIAQGFYQIEDALIVDMLVRNPCIKEKDIEDLLKFDLKMLRARLATLKNEKIIQLRLRMETGLDGKAQKVNYYFINYKSLVNVIKYKLDHLRKRMETLERDATHRASFACTNCAKTFTDLEAGELFDPATLQFRCTFCYQIVEEDESSGPKQDSRFVVARFNEQMKVIYDLLEKAEGLKLAPELLEPEPARSSNDANNDSNTSGRDKSGFWSGEATRLKFMSDTRIDIKFGEAKQKNEEERKERPIWLLESTIGDNNSLNSTSQTSWDAETDSSTPSTSASNRASKEDIMNVLLAFEKKPSRTQAIKQVDSDSGSDAEGDKGQRGMNIPTTNSNYMSNNAFGRNTNSSNPTDMETDEVEIMETDDEDEDNNSAPLVSVGSQRIPITEINDTIIEKMTIAEKEAYNQQFQDFYANVFD